MKILLLTDDYQEAAERLLGKFPHPSNCPRIIDSDTTVIADGEVRVIFLRNVILPHLHKLAFQFWKNVDDPLTNRTAILATPSLHRSTGLDGSLSPRHGANARVEKVAKDEGAAQGVLGWDAKKGGLTPMSQKHREMLNANRTLIELVDSLYEKYLPNAHATQRVAVKMNADPDCRIGHTAFSNVYVLKQWASPYHRDTNNLHGVPTAIICCGKFSAGEFQMPRWQLRIPYQPGDLILFDPQQLHGVLPFTGWRLSAAFYASKYVADRETSENISRR